MADPLDLATLEHLLVIHRPFVTRVIQEIARRHHLSADEIEEFDVLVERELERHDYELLRAFEGRSTWETYLATVVTRLFFGFQGERWGQWRPTALATRAGPAAVLLEELMLRDRLSLDNAIEIMRSRHRVDVPRRKLELLARDLRLISASAHRGEEVEAGLAAGPRSHTTQTALRDALVRLSADDRLILALRYVDRQPVTRIAKLLKTDPRPLQRHIDHIQGQIRASLVAQGMPPDSIAELLDDVTGGGSGSVQRRWWEAVLPRPSH